MSSASSFDPSIVKGFGNTEQDTAQKMSNALNAHNLSLSYPPDTKKFTILDSADIDRERIEKIFTEKTYRGWEPHILNETDSLGNKMVELIIAGLYSNKRTTRDNDAKKLISNIQNKLHIPLNNMQCIDIGCRSGENTLAMQEAGAKVIGIDPDDREFPTALEKGLKKEQLFKLTLQEYLKNFPDQKFDIATVFLWNIPFKERASFARALADIIHKDGIVIIGYGDEVYDKHPDINIFDLMRTVFVNIKRVELHGYLNKYMLVCSLPKETP